MRFPWGDDDYGAGWMPEAQAREIIGEAARLWRERQK